MAPGQTLDLFRFEALPVGGFDLTAQPPEYFQTLLKFEMLSRPCSPRSTPIPSPPAVTVAPTATPQVLPPARCNEATESGAGVTSRTYDMGANPGTFTLRYDTYTIPDKIEVFYEGRLVYSTPGLVGEARDVDITFGPGSSTQITVVVTGNTDTSTRWVYTVFCPGVLPPGATTPTPTPTATSIGQASIATDKAVYQIGESIRICYTVPGPSSITITDIMPDGRTQVLLSGNDDGSGDCIPGRVSPPTGRECFRLTYSGTRGSGTRETCIQVVQ